MSNHPLIIGLLLVAWLTGAVGSTVVLAGRGSWLWPFLAVTLQLALAAQWWLSHREGGEAARTADKFLVLVVATLVTFYAMIAS